MTYIRCLAIVSFVSSVRQSADRVLNLLTTQTKFLRLSMISNMFSLYQLYAKRETTEKILGDFTSV